MNPFWRNTRTEKHRPEGDPLSTDPPPPVTGRRDEGPREIVCAGCGCRIARNGDILSTGDTYKKHLKHEQVLEAKDREIEKLSRELNDAKEEITRLKGSEGPKNRQGFALVTKK